MTKEELRGGEGFYHLEEMLILKIVLFTSDVIVQGG